MIITDRDITSATNPSLTQKPLVSLILPIRNEAKFIESTLQAVKAQTYPDHLVEVIIADGNSDDNTLSIVGQFGEKHPDMKLITLNNPRLIFSAGFNLALDHATGDYIVFVGGHSELFPDYVEQCVHHLQTTDADCVGGFAHYISATPFSNAVALATKSRFGMGNVAFRTVRDRTLETDTVPFGAYRREVFDRIGKLDEELVRNQDDEFNYRLRKQGGKILFSPAIQSRYHGRSSLPRLWKQYYQYGFWKVRVMQKHPRQMRMRHFVPAVFVGTLIVLAILALFHEVFRCLFLALMGLYLCANVLFSLTIAREEGWKYVIRLPVVFAALHFSYGTGFLVGLVKFRNGRQ